MDISFPHESAVFASALNRFVVICCLNSVLSVLLQQNVYPFSATVFPVYLLSVVQKKTFLYSVKLLPTLFIVFAFQTLIFSKPNVVITLKCTCSISISLQCWIVLQHSTIFQKQLYKRRVKDKVSMFTDNHVLSHRPCIRFKSLNTFTRNWFDVWFSFPFLKRN